MEPSIAGFLVLACLLMLGYWLGSPIVVGLFASLSFGSTAIATLGALGGSSPLIYTAFVLLLLISVSLQRGFVDDLSIVFSKNLSAWIVGGVILYSIFSAIILPRLFAGETIVFVATPSTGVQELALAPVSGNITQTGYFVLGALAFFAFAVLLHRKGQVENVRRGFLVWMIINAGLGALDLTGKIIGVGDILSPIRTASYTFLVEVEEAGFWRIAGGFAEASAFGSVTLSCLAFSFTYWRVSRSWPMLLLTVVLFFLILLSTSSTAYAGLMIVAPFAVASIAASALRGRFSSQDFVLLMLVYIALIVVLLISLVDERIFDPIKHLFATMVLNKATSESAQVRLYWNSQSMQALIDTAGLGVGLGSSRAASWVVAVLSQLGIIGGLMMGGLVAILLWDMISPKPAHVDREILALASGARASALAAIAGSTISGGAADPGLGFFISLAVVSVYRKHATIGAPPRRQLAQAGFNHEIAKG